MSAPVDGTNTVFSTSPDGTTWTPRGNVVSIKPGKSSAKEIDYTTHGSVTNGERLMRPGLSKTGPTEIEMLYDATVYPLMKAFYRVAGSHFKITYADSGNNVCTGYVSEIDTIETPMDDDATFSFSVQPSGGWTFSAT